MYICLTATESSIHIYMKSLATNANGNAITLFAKELNPTGVGECVCVCVCVYIYIYIYIYSHPHIYVRVCMYAPTCGLEQSSEKLPAATYASMQISSYELNAPIADKCICEYLSKKVPSLMLRWWKLRPSYLTEVKSAGFRSQHLKCLAILEICDTMKLCVDD